MEERHETVIVGGGHAGLALSYHLSRRGRAHVVLERGRVAERWRSERWDSLHFQFPNWSLALPGQPYDGPSRTASRRATRSSRFIERYCAAIAAPVRTGVARGPRSAPSRGRRLPARDRARRSRRRQRRRRHRPVPGAGRPGRSAGRCRAAWCSVHSTRLPQSRPAVRPARCSWSARAPRAARSWRTCSRRAGRVFLSVGRHRRLPAPLPRPRHVLVDGADGRARPERSRSAPRRASGRIRS